MGSAAEKVVAEALELDVADRTEVVERLLRSQDDGEADGELDSADRQRLHEAIARSEQQFQADRGIPADVVLADLDRR